jgi:hypothetical protein
VKIAALSTCWDDFKAARISSAALRSLKITAALLFSAMIPAWTVISSSSASRSDKYSRAKSSSKAKKSAPPVVARFARLSRVLSGAVLDALQLSHRRLCVRLGIAAAQPVRLPPTIAASYLVPIACSWLARWAQINLTAVTDDLQIAKAAFSG